jgi:hypothetical protein
MVAMDDEPLLTAPFTRAQALAAGVTSRMLQGQGYVRVHPRVWKRADHVMSEDDWVTAAMLALPSDAHLTGITRLQRLGLEYGPRRPIRFVVQGDLHRAVAGIFLHRTKQLPPLDDVGVCVEATFMSYCSLCRVIDAVKVGDWLLHHQHMDGARLLDLAVAQPWRAGAQEVMWVEPFLDPRARSLKESETRSILEFAGLPRPESNVELGLDEDIRVVGDLVYREWGTVVEYEGTQHQQDREQYTSDIDRYAVLREHGRSYVQVTKEHLANPRNVARRVDAALRRNGYDGAPPVFGPRWDQLFGSLRSAVGPREVVVRTGPAVR